MSRREQIRMTDAEVEAFLASNKTAILCSNGKRGYPHPVPMWFTVAADGAIEMTTYRRSQKVMNLRRDPRVTVLVESGEEYAELKSVQIEGRAELIEDTERVLDTLLAAANRGREVDARSPEVRASMAGAARKRVLIRVVREHVISWDHTKLGGVY